MAFAYEKARARMILGRTALALLFACAPARAQVPGAGEALRETAPPPAAPTRPAPDIQLEAPPRPALKPAPDLRVAVKSFRISGNSVFPEAELLALIEDFTGKDLTFSDLQQAAARITSYYRERGYFLAQAYLPQQTIKDGLVEIAVIEGRLGEIRINRAPGVRLAENVARGLLEVHAVPGRALELGATERGLLLLNDLPGVDVASTLGPGQAVGSTDLTVELRGRPLLSGAASLDNYGSRFTGRHRLTGVLNVNDPLGRGDQLSLRGLVTEDDRLHNIGASYLLPVGRHGTRIGAGYSDLRYRLGKDFAALAASGSARVASLSVQHPFIRSRAVNLYGQMGWEHKRLEDRQAATGFLNDRKLDNLSAGLSADARDAAGGGGLNFASVTVVSGRLDLRTPAIAAADAAPGGRGTRGDFTKLGYSVSRTQALHGALSAYARITGQASSRNLDSAEKFSLGGPFGVRAYPIAEASADEGYVVSAELRWGLPAPARIGSLALIGFYDHGQARINRDPAPADLDNRARRSGYGLGLDWFDAGRLAVRASLAWRNSRTSTSDPAADRNPRFYLQGTTFF